MPITLLACLFLAIFFLTMFVTIEMGRWFGGRQFTSHTSFDSPRGVGTIEASVFGLLGLLIAFTFAGAESRFETRRQLIVQESNAIGTAYLRLNLLPASAQSGIRAAFRSYTDARIAYFRAG